MKYLFVLTGALLCAAAAPAPVVVNAGFEAADTDGRPTGWRTAGVGYAGDITRDAPGAGQSSGHLRSLDRSVTPQRFGALAQSVDAEAFRGHRVRFRALARTSLPSAGAGKVGLWLRVDGEAGEVLSIDNMAGRPIVAPTWTPVDIVAQVPQAARKLTFGLLLNGAGEAWIDEASLKVVDGSDAGEPAKTISVRQVENLSAFANAFGYVRFFYAGDEAAAADWNTVALNGVQLTEDARSPEELARGLEAVFQPIAPGFRAWPTGRAAPAFPTVDGQGLRWRHEGFGLGSGGPYRSTRVTVAKGDAGDNFTAAVPGGVNVGIPLVVGVTDGHTRPQAAAPPPKLRKPDDFMPSGDDRVTRLADVVMAWSVLRQFYPYFDTSPISWKDELPRALSEASADRDAAAFKATLERLIAALGDGHGAVSGPQDRLGRLPVQLAWIEGHVVVTAVGPGATLQPGDVVSRLDGVDMTVRLAEAEAQVSGATPQWRRWRALNLVSFGAAGTTAHLDILRDGVPRTAELTRSTTQPPSEPRPDSLSEPRPDYVYVDLDRISDADLKAAIPRLAAAKGVIFDLRGYPKPRPDFLAHLSDRTVTSAEWNVPILTRPDQQGATWKPSHWTLPPQAPRVAGKVVFITDGRAISYAESVLGVVEGAHLAAIVGEPTAGTNGDVVSLPLAGGYAIRWTGLKVLKSDGSRHHGVGIIPTVPAHRTLAGVRAGRDELLEAALQTATAVP